MHWSECRNARRERSSDSYGEYGVMYIRNCTLAANTHVSWCYTLPSRQRSREIEEYNSYRVESMSVEGVQCVVCVASIPGTRGAVHVPCTKRGWLSSVNMAGSSLLPRAASMLRV